MRSPEDLLHVIRPLPSGGRVIVIDTAAIIDPEAQAMICARFSRWNKETLELVISMFNRDVGKFMRGNYKAGYGHKSIAEMGEAVIFIEDVSMLCAKAIQDFPLYRGQESSTRYVDFSEQKFLNPLESDDCSDLIEEWRAFHVRGLDVMVPALRDRYPISEGENPKDYAGAIKARAFDIMRGFLPAGATTNVAWVGDLRHVNDHLSVLRNHPLAEVRSVGLAIEDALIEKYPNSFSKERRPETEAFLEQMGQQFAYLNHADWNVWPEFSMASDNLESSLLERYIEALASRPYKAELPWSIRECGSMRFEFMLDFGSYRDLQRQRAIIIPLPLLTPTLGFEPWYLDQLTDELRSDAETLIDEFVDAWETLSQGNMVHVLQYYVPMGMRVPIRMVGDIRGMVYMVELRTTRFVHPTLMVRERQLGAVLSERIPGIALHMDPDPGRFDVRRGSHDFVKS